MKAINTALLWLLAFNLKAACHVSATGMNFGGYDVFEPLPRTSMAAINVWCDPGTPADVSIRLGASTVSGGIYPRYMQGLNGGERMAYNLFTDAASTSVWGDGVNGDTVTLPHVTPNKTVTTTLYGAIPARQNLSTGNYSDSVTVLVMP